MSRKPANFKGLTFLGVSESLEVGSPARRLTLVGIGGVLVGFSWGAALVLPLEDEWLEQDSGVQVLQGAAEEGLGLGQGPGEAAWALLDPHF